MESYVSRSRSSRSNYRKRRNNLQTQNKISKMLKQLILSAAIFVIIFTIKNVDSSITNYLTAKTAAVLKADADVNYVLDYTKKAFASLKVSNEKIKAVFGSPTNSQNNVESVIPEEMKDKVYEASLLKEQQIISPVEGVITSVFGTRVSPITKLNEFHEGIDISPINDDVKASFDGEVIFAGTSDSLGNYVKIKNNDLTALYAHASKILVQEGQIVKKGEVIAKAGSTGYSIGKHVHFELRNGEKLVDPQKLLNLKVQN